MNQIVVLDTGVLGLLTHPTTSPTSEQCYNWFNNLVAQSVVFVLPEIADYELRREVLRTRQAQAIRRLDNLKQLIRYEPITTAAMLEAARLWAWTRNQGNVTADPRTLDADVILAGQVAQLTPLTSNIIIATSNVRHLALFADARHWQDITVS